MKLQQVATEYFYSLKQFPVLKQSNFLKNQTGKTTPIRRAAVRETGASRHQGGPTEVPLPETPRTTIALNRIEGFKGPSIGPHDAERR